MTVAPPPAQKEHGVLRWHRRVLGICLAIFAFELGLFLVVFPWLKNWDLSWIPLQSPIMARVWMSPYFRGALSGLGFLNIYIGCVELVRQLKLVFKKS